MTEETKCENCEAVIPPGKENFDPEGIPLCDECAKPYLELVEKLALKCTCDGERPCDGLLAGGLCDDRREEKEEQP